MGRAPCCDKSKVKRGPWSPEEDDTLKTYLEKHGTVGNWIALPHKAGLNRCGKSCRLRWLNYLRPDIKHGGFTDEEDNVICTLYNTIGSRWSIIASQLPGRTDNDVKNYWNTKLKKKLLVSGGTGFNHNIDAKISVKADDHRENSARFSGFVPKIESSHQHQWNSGTIGQSSSQPSPHAELFGFGSNGNTSSSVSSTLEASNSSSPPLGFDSDWGVNGDEDHGILMEYFGYYSSDVLINGDFGF